MMIASPWRLFCLALSLLFLCAAAPDAVGNNAIQWRSLKHVQSTIGITNYTWDGDSLCLSNHQHHVRFYTGRKKAEVNGTVVWLNAPTEGVMSDGSWRLAGIDLDFLNLSVLPLRESRAKPLRVLLDPGHGGSDNGACSKNPVIKEKDLTLTLAKRIGAQLKKAGMIVDYTRTTDVALSLDERSRIARKKKADIFISIHANHAGNTDASGVETYILPPSGYPGTAQGTSARGWQIGNRNDYHNTMLGFSIHRKLAATPGTIDRGLKRQSFFVLRETDCPAVLLEFGFLSNQTETCRMLRADWQEHSTAAVVAGVLSYAKKIEPLNTAVAAKRQRDAEANERWRQHLAAKARAAEETTAAKKKTAAPPSPPPAIAANTRVTAPLPKAVSPKPETAPPEEPKIAQADTPKTVQPPSDSQTIFDFYLANEQEP